MFDLQHFVLHVLEYYTDLHLQIGLAILFLTIQIKNLKKINFYKLEQLPLTWALQYCKLFI